MSNYKKINKLKEQLESELVKESPDMKVVSKLRSQIMMIGLGLTYKDIKPY